MVLLPFSNKQKHFCQPKIFVEHNCVIISIPKLYVK